MLHKLPGLRRVVALDAVQRALVTKRALERCERRAAVACEQHLAAPATREFSDRARKELNLLVAVLARRAVADLRGDGDNLPALVVVLAVPSIALVPNGR